MIEKKLAIIKHVHCGVGDYGKFALWFDTYINDHEAALQVFHGGDKVAKIVEDYGVSEVSKLEGKACWVASDGNMIRWLGPAKI